MISHLLDVSGVIIEEPSSSHLMVRDIVALVRAKPHVADTADESAQVGLSHSRCPCLTESDSDDLVVWQLMVKSVYVDEGKISKLHSIPSFCEPITA